MFKYIKQIWNSKDLRKKILFTFFLILVYRLIAHISVPGVDTRALEVMMNSNSLLGIFAAMTGGSMDNFSIVLMGISPYINASIIIQLMTVVVPHLEQLSKEGEQGRNKINKYTRWLTLPLAFLQSYGMIILLNVSAQGQLIADVKDPAIILPIMLYITAGTVFLMWLGEVITEKGIGNGISLIIMFGIIANMPAVVGRILGLSQYGDTTKLVPFLIFMVFTFVILIFVIIFTEGQRKIPLTYTGRSTRGEKSFLPIRVNQAGMIPIIFAISMVTFPGVLAQFFQNAKTPFLQKTAEFILNNFSTQNPSASYLVIYFLLVVAFSYFYVSVTFNPEQVAENIQKRGGFIPGIRPGAQTTEFLGKTSSYLNLSGGIFLAIVAVVPLIFTKFTSLSSGDLIISGSGLIIIVGVILEIIRQINAQMVMHDYDKLY